jgi:hypothetical protein
MGCAVLYEAIRIFDAMSEEIRSRRGVRRKIQSCTTAAAQGNARNDAYDAN